MVVRALRDRFGAIGKTEHPAPTEDRNLVERHIERIVVKPEAVEVYLSCVNNSKHGDLPPATITLPWTAPSFAAVKGVLHTPSQHPTLKPETRDTLLSAIAKARGWIDDLAEYRVTSFAEIAAREGKVERHIRLLAPLAFLSPRIIAAIVDGATPANLTITGLAKALPYSWAKQEKWIGFPQAQNPTQGSGRQQLPTAMPDGGSSFILNKSMRESKFAAGHRSLHTNQSLSNS